MKKTWSTLSDILNRNTKKSLPDTMTIKLMGEIAKINK